MICELCIAMGGRFNANRECCQIRLVAGMPDAARIAALEKVRRESGAQAVQQFREKVRAEYARQRDHRRELARAAREKLKAA